MSSGEQTDWFYASLHCDNNNNNKHAYAGVNDCFTHLRALLVLHNTAALIFITIYFILWNATQIDVELAELEVLQGIDDDDWPKIGCVTGK